MNTNKMELNMNELEQVNGGFSFNDFLVKVGFFIFKPGKKVDKDDTDRNRSTDMVNLCAH